MAAIAPVEEPQTGAEIPELMDEKALCAILNISPATARRYRAAGQIVEVER